MGGGRTEPIAKVVGCGEGPVEVEEEGRRHCKGSKLAWGPHNRKWGSLRRRPGALAAGRRAKTPRRGALSDGSIGGIAYVEVSCI